MEWRAGALSAPLAPTVWPREFPPRFAPLLITAHQTAQNRRRERLTTWLEQCTAPYMLVIGE
jgi:hypothetical protein